MANSFVKWCRAKFFNGYKHINVLAQEEGCGRSDTETLVRAGEEDLLIPTPTPPLPSAHARPAHHPLAAGTYVEEVSCDVSVAAGDLDRQEFSFTLYDFDGHGTVTKDDIAGLVRTIYEAVGSSLSLPPSGSRTIKVKLTVAPEPHRSRTPHVEKEAGQQQQQQQQQEKNVEDEDYEEEDGCGGAGGKGGQRGRRGGGRRRSTSLQRHELLQIIQANMEKNNLFYTPLHRPPHPHLHPHHHPHAHHHHHHHHHPRRRRPRPSCPCSPPDPAHVKARLLEPDCPCRHTHYHNHTHGPARAGGCRRHHRSHSHDLAPHSPPHVFRAHLSEKPFQPLPPTNTPDHPPSPPTLPHHLHHHNHHQQQPRHHHHHHHHRSRSYDGGDTQRSSPRGGRGSRGSRCPQQQSSPQSQKTSPEQPPQVPQAPSPAKESPRGGGGGGGDGAPHPSKNRHRAAEHDRAMAQVVAWLERGSLLEAPCSPVGGGEGGGEGGGGGSGSTAEQTHHVHQHIHHHYHHYSEQQLPPLVL